jgi:hypothetical protein
LKHCRIIEGAKKQRKPVKSKKMMLIIFSLPVVPRAVVDEGPKADRTKLGVACWGTVRAAGQFSGSRPVEQLRQLSHSDTKEGRVCFAQ